MTGLFECFGDSAWGHPQVFELLVVCAERALTLALRKSYAQA